MKLVPPKAKRKAARSIRHAERVRRNRIRLALERMEPKD